MNKLIIVLLAVCLVSVHAFVKRDAEAPQSGGDNQLKDFFNKANEQLKEFLDPEKMKKTFNEIVDNVNKLAKDVQSKHEGQ